MKEDQIQKNKVRIVLGKEKVPALSGKRESIIRKEERKFLERGVRGRQEKERRNLG